MEPTIFFLSSPELLPASEIGAKAWGLWSLTRAGFCVPPGFVLTTHFLQSWVEALSARPEWAAFQSGAFSPHAQAALRAACLHLPFSPEQQEALREALDDLLRRSPGLLAVRSSSPEEDLEEASFAGGYETTLGVTAGSIEDAIRRCFASAFEERVFRYRQAHGLPPGPPRMAVLVQHQVTAVCAGVMFSLNPLNNCYDEALINASPGLGEVVVSGAVNPDVFVVDKVQQQVLEMHAAGKIACLLPGQALELAMLAVQVEKHFQKPVDVEWALADGQIHLLQARPITAWLPLPPEMLTAPGAPRRLYANSTLIEQGLQQPLSVLGTDFLRYVLEQAGGPVAQGAIGPGGITFTAAGGYYMNISYARKMRMPGGGLAPGSAGDPGVTAILEHMNLRPYLEVPLSPRLKAMRARMALAVIPMARSALAAWLRPLRLLHSYQEALPAVEQRLAAFTGAGMTLQEQALALAGFLKFFYTEYGIPMILAGQLAIRRIQRMFVQRGSAAPEKNHVQELLARLGVALPGNKTTEMGERMAALAIAPEVARSASAQQFLADLEADRVTPTFRQAWQEFLAEFGMRCPSEIDPATPRLYEQPAQLFEQLKRMAPAASSPEGAARFAEARRQRETAYQALQALARQQGRRQAQALEKFYQAWLSFGGFRETPKHYAIQVIDLFRRQALETGRGLTAEGRLDNPAQVFDLEISDIDRARRDPALDLRALAEERTALIRRIRRFRRPVWVIDSRGKIFDPPAQTGEAALLYGLPVSPGVARGPARVFQHAGEKSLQPGDILVVRAADPGWTPLFLSAAGIVLEIGGALQHAAVVAREYGVPCVSGVTNAVTQLKDGQWVEVDGTHGTVRMVSPDKPQPDLPD